MSGEWILEQTDSEKFPYLLTITEQGLVRQQLLVQDSWPAEGKNTFCLRPERHTQQWNRVAGKERVPIKSIKERGRLLSVVLERSVRKRCEFLFTEKAYKNKPGKYEQIFWRTPDYFRQRPVSVRIGAERGDETEILVDTQERYAYRFDRSRRERLPVGDYAVRDGRGGILAVVERKRFRDFLFSLKRINVLHLNLTELAAYPVAAMVVEAPFHYFLNPDKLGPYELRASNVEQMLMELYATHPGVHLVFLENRKMAQRWCASFLRYCSANLADGGEGSYALSEPGPESYLPEYSRPEDMMRSLPHFTFAQLCNQFPQWSRSSLRNLLSKYRKQGWLACRGRGIKAYWTRTEQD